MSALARWSRLEANPAFGSGGLGSLKTKRAVCVGAGGLAGPALGHLAMLGIETVIIDRDVVAPENLGTQGFPESMVGLPKAQVRALALGEINSSWKVHALHADFRRVGLGLFADADIVLCALDSASARAMLSEAMTRVGRVWLDAAVDATGRPFGRVACYDPRRPETGCYACPHTARSLAELVRGATERCPSAHRREEPSPPTLATSMLSAWVAAVQAHWAVELLLGRGADLPGSETYMDLSGLAVRRHRLPRNSECVFDHQIFAPVFKLGCGVAETSVGETLEAAAGEVGPEAQLRLWRDPLAVGLRCVECGSTRRPFRLLGALGERDLHCACGGPMAAPADSLLDRFGAAEAEPFAERTWAELGLPDSEIIGARGAGREIYLRFD
jgi:adenylyltransferase/sulfurtransferase